MACKNICRLCDRLIISQAVNFSTTEGLLISLPAGSYLDGEKYCIVIAQAIPAVATINAPVFITIGTGAARYQLVGCDCRPLTACAVHTRTKYSTRVQTTATSGVFRLLGKTGCTQNQRTSIDGT